MALSFAGTSQIQSFEVIQTDTINRIDIRNQKQGKWVIHGYNRATKKLICTNSNQIVEEGLYINNRKSGIWIEYYCNSKKRSELTYVNGVLEGKAIFYSSDGKIIKEGKFKGNKWAN